jgi:hypothetical protein
MLGTDRLIDTVRGHKKSVVYLGAALALTSAGTANAATIGHAPAGHQAAAPATAQARTTALIRSASRNRAGHRHQGRAHGDWHRPSSHRPASHHAGSRRATWHHGGPRRGFRHHATNVDTWASVSAQLNQETNPAAARLGQLPMADRLLPTALSGPQSYMPISPAQYANATAIVQQALDKRMGVRSAVIAVATAMQESELINVDYGTSDSLGLFQQQPDCGWGTAAQVMDPHYAADAFLGALARYQASDPTWADQPLYQAAQAVQASAFPTAYAKWEAQAAQLVKSIAMQLR